LQQLRELFKCWLYIYCATFVRHCNGCDCECYYVTVTMVGNYAMNQEFEFQPETLQQPSKHYRQLDMAHEFWLES